MEQFDSEKQSRNYQPAKPNNNMALAIITTVLFCLPLGIVGIVKANKVNTLYNGGQYEAAKEAAKEAKKYSIIGIVICAAIILIYVIIVGISLSN